jgi:myo-inositol-1(or 4)-monophosphatase
MQRLINYQSAVQNTRLANRLQFAVQAAIGAGSILRDLENQPHRIREKGSIDLVTEADLAAEQHILSYFADKTPGIAILAEESAADFSRVTDAPCWVIDPLDGTTNYAHGFPWYAVSIAYMEKKIPLIGAVYQVPGDTLFFAVKGNGASMNGREIRVSGENSLQRSLLATGFPYDIKNKYEPVLEAIREILPRAQGLRRAGSAALDLAHLAAGHLDGFWEIELKPWDTAAGMLLVEEAGGTLTDFSGRPYSPFAGEILASNGKIHSEMQRHLAAYSA